MIPEVLNRDMAVSFVCHLASVKSYFAHHRNCDGKSYTPDITDKGTPCICTCHRDPA